MVRSISVVHNLFHAYLFDAMAIQWDKGSRETGGRYRLSSGNVFKNMEEQTMQNKERKLTVSAVAVGLLLANPVYAFDMGNMMNPSKWMDNNKNNDRYDDYYDGPGYGYPGGPPGYGYGGPGYGGPGYGGPGYGYGGDPGYGAGPGYGYGGDPGYGTAPGYGYGGDPGYGAVPGYGAAPAYSAPGTESREAEIRRLKERLRQLESGPR